MDMEAGRSLAKKPVYKQWWFWAIVIGVVVVLGVGGFLLYWLVFRQAEDNVPPEQASYEKCKMSAVEKLALAISDTGTDAAKVKSAKIQFIKDLNKCIDERKDPAYEFLDVLQEKMKCGDDPECENSFKDNAVELNNLLLLLYYQLLSEAATTTEFFNAAKSKFGLDVAEATKNDFLQDVLLDGLKAVRGSKSAATFAKTFETHKITHGKIKGDAKVVAKVADSVGKVMEKLSSKSEPVISYRLIDDARLGDNLKSFIKRAKAIKDVQLMAEAVGYHVALYGSVTHDQADLKNKCKDHDDSKHDEKPLNAAWEKYKKTPEDKLAAIEFAEQIREAAEFFYTQAGKQATI
jgi:hypothetical protein